MDDLHYQGPIFQHNNSYQNSNWRHEGYALPKATQRLLHAQVSTAKPTAAAPKVPLSSAHHQVHVNKSKPVNELINTIPAALTRPHSQVDYQALLTTYFIKNDDEVYLFTDDIAPSDIAPELDAVSDETSIAADVDSAVLTTTSAATPTSAASAATDAALVSQAVQTASAAVTAIKDQQSSAAAHSTALTNWQQARWVKEQMHSKKPKLVRHSPSLLQQSVHQAMQSYHREQKQNSTAPAMSSSSNEVTQQSSATKYQFPSLDLLAAPTNTDQTQMRIWAEKQVKILNETLAAFHVQAQVARYTIGPTVTQFEISLARGVKVNKITNLNDDLKLALAARDIRIEAPIPGKNTVGIEIPNLLSRTVMLAEVLRSDAFQKSKSPLTVALGVDLFGKPMVADIGEMPHGLIAGATGSGKSVFINSILISLLYKALPTEVKLLLIDPKAVELAPYNGLPHLLAPVISDPKAAAEALKWTVNEMENRYQKLAAAGVRNIQQFNERAKAHGDYGLVMPYIVIIIDELADLMMVASNEVQDYIARITQKARAAGIHLLVATQRPSVDVITGTIKNNIPTRVAFMVASQIDSRTILDTAGAERLLGRGDMLYLGNGKGQPIRLQGTYVEPEIDAIVAFVKQQMPPHYLFNPDNLLKAAVAEESEDAIFGQVLEYIANEKQVSTSKLQRVFSIGYNRAANLIDELESRHYISTAHGSKPRDIYFTKDDLQKYQEKQIAHL
ncbi:MAG: DNA translocase FtsK [Candidatus Paralactobacillus gallistercoris]|uniref:DNA translocase FtsK n=1 Tax=Candidatus Paralactobacillus gallistercoris TaxID=2838724 RepID=A0A948TJT9_9LACO|nr:DNA translocase FtsK [Candidatus Paralactobacillus gallistercoris]